MALITNLIEYWKLDEASGNATGSIASTVLTNTGSAAYSAAKINNGIDFGSVNTTKYLSNATNLGITGGAATISCWVNQVGTPVTNDAWVYVHQDSATNNDEIYIFQQDNASVKQIVIFRVKQNVANDEVRFNYDANGTGWHHYIYTYDGTNVRGYLDGVLKGITASSGNGSSAGVNGFRIGANVNNGGNKLSGMVDEVGVWSRALTDGGVSVGQIAGGEIAQLYNGGAGLTYPFSATSTSAKFFNFF